MTYTVLIYQSEAARRTRTPEKDEADLQIHRQMQQEAAAKNHLVASTRLAGPATALHVKPGPGKSIVLDGPFAETKELMVGLYAFDCEKEDVLHYCEILTQTGVTLELRDTVWSWKPNA